MFENLDILLKDLHTDVNDSCIDLMDAKKLESELNDRRLYLFGEIKSLAEGDEEVEYSSYSYYETSKMSAIAEHILEYNRQDRTYTVEERRPIRLYINSPGGDVCEGFALLDVMRLSKTPIYTINLGEWSSMAFLIGIAGTKRFSLPSATFMMHEPSGLTVGKFSDMTDKVLFNKKYACKVIKRHILEHSRMSPSKYGSVSKKDFYMLAEEALKYGFIDEIATEIDTIL